MSSAAHNLIEFPGSAARIGRTYPANAGDLDRWKSMANDSHLGSLGLMLDRNARTKAGLANDAFSNIPARMGFASGSVAEGAEYELVRWSYNYWLMITLYRNQWIPRNIVDIPANDMVRAWPKIMSDMDPNDLTKVDRCIRQTQTQSQLREVLKWARLFGGAGALMVIDGHDNRLDEPLDLDTVELGAYRGLIPFDRWVGIYPDDGVSSDLSKPLHFNLPEYYRVQTPGGSSGFRIHASRILRFTGPSVPAPELQAQQYWGISVLEIAYEAMKMRDNMLWNMLGLTFRANLLSFKFDELAQALSGASMNQQALVAFYNRMEALNGLLSNQNMLITPKDGGLDSTQYAFGGCSDMMEQFRYEVSGSSRIPEMRLFGRSPSGMGIKDDPAERLYEEMIAVEQDDKLRPQLDRLYPVMCMSSLGYVPDDLDLDFPSIRVPGEDEKANLATSIATSIVSTFGAGLISKEIALKELKQSSAQTGIYSNIADEDIEAAKKEDEEAKKLQQAQQLAASLGEGEPGGEPGGEGAEAEQEPAEADEPARAADSLEAKRDIAFAGLPITVEFEQGERRIIRNADGEAVYNRVMAFPYGEIRGTVGRDGDAVDVIIGPNEGARFVYVCDMEDPGPDVDQRQDEDKVCLGFQSESAAIRAFESMYPPSWLRGIEELTLEEFIAGLEDDGADFEAIMCDGAEFKEQEHPRASNGENAGQFVPKGSGGGASSSSSKSAALKAAPTNRADWPEDVRKLKIPPAWSDVRIDPSPDADLIAVGKDTKGRPQYVYSQRFQDSQAAKKFERIKKLDAEFDKVRNQNEERCNHGDPATRQNAQCARLVMAMGIRPGSDTDTKAKVKAYGATTLKGEHVVKDGDEVYLRFTGKKGVAINLPVTDPKLAKELVERKALSGAEGRLFPGVTDKSLLAYTHTLDGGKLKTKDFRTLTASREAMVAMKDIDPPKNEKDYKLKVMEVAKHVSAKLGNTPVVALQSYIPPALFSSWRSNLAAA